tara:strand:- start:1764 stop:2261 length:498 start_codon:yes stop_codon:yes gene_type:complete
MPAKLLYTVIIGLFWSLHPFHVSVCDMEYNKEAKALQISQRIFMDDLATGLQSFHKMDYIDTYKPKDPKKLDSLINEYIQAKLFITIDGKKAKLDYIGSELEGDARWCYIEVKNISSISELDISNVVLFESFPQQENIVHLKVNEQLKSYKLNKKEISHLFKFAQ